MADTAGAADTAGDPDTDLTDALGADAINDADTAGAADTAGDPDTDLADALGADAINVNAVDSGTIDAVNTEAGSTDTEAGILEQEQAATKIQAIARGRQERARAKATKSVKVNPVDFNDLEMSLGSLDSEAFFEDFDKGQLPIESSKPQQELQEVSPYDGGVKRENLRAKPNPAKIVYADSAVQPSLLKKSRFPRIKEKNQTRRRSRQNSDPHSLLIWTCRLEDCSLHQTVLHRKVLQLILRP